MQNYSKIKEPVKYTRFSFEVYSVLKQMQA